MIVVDTGVLYALADASDTHHASCTRWLRATSDELVVPALVITEAAYLIGSRGGPAMEALFLDALSPQRRFRVGQLDPERDLPRIAALVRAYSNLPLGTVDAAVVALAERLECDTIATVDRKDFSIVRPGHVPAFILVPDPDH